MSPAPRARGRHVLIGRVLRRADRTPKQASAMLWTGVGLIGFVLLASLIGRFVLPEPNQQDLLATLQAPSLDHPFGTDELGRDVLSRTLAATWLDLGLAIGATLASAGVGLLVGAAAGYAGGWVERILMRVVDFVIAFPYFVFVLAVVAIMRPGVGAVVVAVVSFNWAFYARLGRANMLVLREKQFIQAARTLGFSGRRVVLRHALPNLLRPVAVYSMSDVVVTILTVAGLSFLGLGVPPPTPEWGAIIASGQPYLTSAWWISTFPGIVVMIVGLGFSLVGDALAERLGVEHEAVVK
ncbi:ABC transporter permease [Conexibacter woesei]|uniref:Binding-protein-dependent transport systems inner membrane component n=1 Tax=Conexibacter woesei (strain DSM 14684 / CCUG 47730 / CIP 108061 / JCM 11494 / NBRC 100937 / ID131577) TaxID=469383 RepID=D3FDA3_CONWI|nr:ABC transporter permease [Conexibacter woesei]ADB53495.1 binding-protein-dependent transport systems inner membrane component [Conexibacter woesei DSM 14684]